MCEHQRVVRTILILEQILAMIWVIWSIADSLSWLLITLPFKVLLVNSSSLFIRKLWIASSHTWILSWTYGLSSWFFLSCSIIEINVNNLAWTLSISLIKRSILDGFGGGRWIGMLFALDILWPGNNWINSFSIWNKY